MFYVPPNCAYGVGLSPELVSANLPYFVPPTPVVAVDEDDAPILKIYTKCIWGRNWHF
jgi:hypothetical protein